MAGHHRPPERTRLSVHLVGQELKLSRFEADPTLHEGDERYIWWDTEKSVLIHMEGGAI